MPLGGHLYTVQSTARCGLWVLACTLYRVQLGGAWTVGGAVGKPAPFCARCCKDGGEPELRKLGARGEPTAEGGLPILGAEACGEDGVGDNGGYEPSPST